jgi:hypothetical protein
MPSLRCQARPTGRRAACPGHSLRAMPAVPVRACPDRAEPCHSIVAQPALRCPALPVLTVRRHAQPAMPFRSPPLDALPPKPCRACVAGPCPPLLASVALPCLRCGAQPDLAVTCAATPSAAQPAVPGQAVPRIANRAVPRHACGAYLRLASFPSSGDSSAICSQIARKRLMWPYLFSTRSSSRVASSSASFDSRRSARTSPMSR